MPYACGGGGRCTGRQGGTGRQGLGFGRRAGPATSLHYGMPLGGTTVCPWVAPRYAPGWQARAVVLSARRGHGAASPPDRCVGSQCSMSRHSSRAARLRHVLALLITPPPGPATEATPAPHRTCPVVQVRLTHLLVRPPAGPHLIHTLRDHATQSMLWCSSPGKQHSLEARAAPGWTGPHPLSSAAYAYFVPFGCAAFCQQPANTHTLSCQATMPPVPMHTK